MTDGYSLRYTVPHTVTHLSPTKALMESTGPTEAVWVPDPRPVPEGLQEGFKAPPFDATEVVSKQPELTGPTSLRTDTDEWLEIGRRLSDSDLAALQKVLGLAADVMS
jgi:hypothetical protein